MDQLFWYGFVLIQYDGVRSKVWIDVEKTPEQLKPGRLIRRAEEIITNLESEKDVPETIEAIMRNKQIKRDGHIIMFLMGLDFRWTTAGRAVFDQETRELIEAYADA